MIKIFPNTAELSQAAAQVFTQTARQAVQENGRFAVALTGGSSPRQLYQLLAQAPYREQVPWEQTLVFWGDERWVPLSDERSNARMAFQTLLDQVPVPQDQIFPMWGEGSPDQFAHVYEKTLRKQLGPAARFDLVLLGMGDDGHTASLFPRTAVLQERERLVQAYFLEAQNMHRITLTAPCLNQARKIVFMTFGEKKAPALYEVLEGERNSAQYPAQLIQPERGEVLWLVDEAAANKLSST
ncbi:6-phosphogluconolactonase [Rufibacter psychrotolerans]|uniref:6-phosphogluconolactonase n=1 Tax=Rufibacter psychrotolerans TaxID=2812556 RepID=UPI001966D967|nr:6-phosphogluconolactonase [Rufibacter sp. SYSU D00308]